MSTLLDLVKEDFGISGSGRWWRSDVHSSLVIDVEKDYFYFNSRDIQGTAIDYLMKVRGFSKEAANQVLKNRTAGNPLSDGGSNLQTRFDKLVDLFHTSARTNSEYWHSRKINDSTISRFRLGYYEGWNLIPIYDNGMFINFQCRKDKPSKQIRLWYKDKDFKPVLFNSDVLKFVKSVYITEGMVDCIYLNQAGFPSVCSTNGAMAWNPGWIKLFSNIESIYYIPDNDSAGINSAKRVGSILGSGRVRIYRFKDKRDKYGALNFFLDGGTNSEFKHILETDSVFGFQKELI